MFNYSNIPNEEGKVDDNEQSNLFTPQKKEYKRNTKGALKIQSWEATSEKLRILTETSTNWQNHQNLVRNEFKQLKESILDTTKDKSKIYENPCDKEEFERKKNMSKFRTPQNKQK